MPRLTGHLCEITINLPPLFCISLDIFQEGLGVSPDSKDEELYFCSGLDTFQRTLVRKYISPYEIRFLKVCLNASKNTGGGQSMLGKI